MPARYAEEHLFEYPPLQRIARTPRLPARQPKLVTVEAAYPRTVVGGPKTYPQTVAGASGGFPNRGKASVKVLNMDGFQFRITLPKNDSDED